MASDRQLLGAYLGGDEPAFREFYERHRRAVYVYLLSLVGRRERAEELLQDVFLGLLRRLEAVLRSANGRANLRPYLMRAARNHAVDLLRRERRQARAIERLARDALFRASRRRDGVETTGVDAVELGRLLGRLPREQREVVVLRELAGLTFREIAVTVGVPENTAVSRYRYGIGKLRDRLGAASRETGRCDDGR